MPRYNHDLANGIGNLVSRFASMVHRYAEGVVPTSDVLDDDRRLLDAVGERRTSFEDAMSRFDHKEALESVAALVRQSNAFVDTRAPWHLSKQEIEDSARLLSAALPHAGTRRLGPPGASARAPARGGGQGRQCPPQHARPPTISLTVPPDPE